MRQAGCVGWRPGWVVPTPHIIVDRPSRHRLPLPLVGPSCLLLWVVVGRWVVGLSLSVLPGWLGEVTSARSPIPVS